MLAMHGMPGMQGMHGAHATQPILAAAATEPASREAVNDWAAVMLLVTLLLLLIIVMVLLIFALKRRQRRMRDLKNAGDIAALQDPWQVAGQRATPFDESFEQNDRDRQ